MDTKPVAATTPALVVNPEKLKKLLSKIENEQNLLLGIGYGVSATLLCAAAWAVITVITNYQIGWMAIGLAFAVGFAVRFGGQGINKLYGAIGAVLALVGCLLGNYLSYVGVIAKLKSMGYFETLVAINPAKIPEIFGLAFQPMDVLFYAMALYFGYKYALRRLTPKELQTVSDPAPAPVSSPAK